MNRKLVNGLLLLTLASGGCGMFTSCKDTDEDWKNQVIVGQVSLEDQIKALEDKIKEIKECTCPNYQTIIDALELKLNDKLAELDQKKADKTEVAALLSQITELNQTIAYLKGNYADLNGRLTTTEANVQNIQGQLTALNGKVENLDGKYEALQSTLTVFQTMLQDQLQTMSNALNAISNTLSAELPEIKTNLSKLANEINGINTQLSNVVGRLDNIDAKLLDIFEQLKTNGALISALQERYNELSARLDTLSTDYADFKAAVEDYKENTIEPALTSLRDLDGQVNGKGGILDQLTLLESRVANNETDIDNLYERIEGVETQISNINARVSMLFSINDRLNSLITSMIVSQTWNPMFGTINLPIGFSTTIAANYYGFSDYDVEFPLGMANGRNPEYNGTKSALTGISDDGVAFDNLVANIKAYEGDYFDKDILNDANQVVLKSNKRYMSAKNNNLGQLYMTINPTNINFSGKNFTLVNSKDEAAPGVTLDVQKCNDEVLTFGANISRAADDNGFYRANVNVDPEQVPALGIRIEDGLKSAMKDALKNHTKQDFAELGKLLYKQMEGVLPAYAVKAEWEAPVIVNKEVEGEDGVQSVPQTEMQKFAVYSKYDLAATAFHPLGYSFLYDVNLTDHHIKLPTFNGSFTEIMQDFFNDLELDFTIDLSPVSGLKPEDFTIDLSGVNLDFSESDMSITIDLSGLKFESTEGEVTLDPETSKITLTYNPDIAQVENPKAGDGALNDFIDELTSKIDALLHGEGDGSLQSVIKKQITDQLVKQVNDMVADINKMLVGTPDDPNSGINAQIKNSIDKVLNQIKNKLAGKLDAADRLVDLYNRLANRINGILSDPNHYLQVMMAYEDGKGELHHLSTNKAFPSPFFAAGGDAIELYATSYTGELIAPSFAKYVAVSRVFEIKDGKVVKHSQSEDMVNTINANNKYLNVLLQGTQQKVAIDARGLDTNYIYEVLYTSVDYRGYTSSRLYYINVVK